MQMVGYKGWSQLHRRRAGEADVVVDGPALRHPQPGQAQDGQGHRPCVIGLFGQLVGLLEALAAGPQVAVLIQRMDPGRNRDGKTAGGIGGKLEPTG